jgi:hypothetical protein
MYTAALNQLSTVGLSRLWPRIFPLLTSPSCAASFVALDFQAPEYIVPFPRFAVASGATVQYCTGGTSTEYADLTFMTSASAAVLATQQDSSPSHSAGIVRHIHLAVVIYDPL